MDASELVKVCSVGNMDAYAMAGFVVSPRVAFLVIGGGFVCAGFSSILSVRRTLRSQVTAANKAFQQEDIRRLDKLMVKIGVFSLLYLLPIVSVICTDLYHAYVLYTWTPHTFACKQQPHECQVPAQKPNVSCISVLFFVLFHGRKM